MEKTVVELFAGVGGFRVGLNKITKFDNNGVAIDDGNFKFLWSNQWEPSTKIQHAFDCYNLRFPDNNSNTDISLVNKSELPDHNLLCGGFPCQDYSVAHSLAKEKGIEGKKGVLWWQIRDILEQKSPAFVLLENVDRLIKSPAKQRGRDFGIMLKCFNELGYYVQWRVINAADYGMPQRRRRIYIFACKNNTVYARSLVNNDLETVLNSNGIFTKTFSINGLIDKSDGNLFGFKDLVDFSNNFKFEFKDSGVMIDGKFFSAQFKPNIEPLMTLRNIIQQNVGEEYYLTKKQIEQFQYLRGNKKILRYKPNGEEYYYTEGAMSPDDNIDLPSRTMLTSEKSINRSTHIIIDPETSRLRFLTPVECERLNQFPDNWTNSGMPEKRRYFMMGNALVCGIVKRLGKEIEHIIELEK